MLIHLTIDTPDGPFTVVEQDGVVVASAWSADAAAVAARAGLAGSVSGTSTAADAVVAYYAGDLEAPGKVSIAPVGTEFRTRVWQQLRATPPGTLRTYGQVA